MQECCAEAHLELFRRTHRIGLLGSQMCRSDLLIEDMLMQAVDAALVDVRTSSRRLAIEAVCSLHRDIGLAHSDGGVPCGVPASFPLCAGALGPWSMHHPPSAERLWSQGSAVVLPFQHGSSNQSTCPGEDCLVHGTVRADDNIFECGLLPGREYVRAQLLSTLHVLSRCSTRRSRGPDYTVFEPKLRPLEVKPPNGMRPQDALLPSPAAKISARIYF